MTAQYDIKKLSEQMAGSMNSFEDIKDFQKQLMQSFIDTALEAEMEDRHVDFEPTLVRKHQTHISGLDDNIIFLYATTNHH